MKTMTMVRGSVLAVVGAVLTMTSAASARDDANPITCFPEPGSNTVTCIIDSGSSASSFLGAMPSDNNGKGGWVEFYSDGEGEWWVEHHQDGGTSVGWETNNIVGPNLGAGTANEKAGSYDKKKRPALKGAVKKVAKRTFASEKAKAQAQTQTATMTFAKAGEVTTGFAGIKFGRFSVQGVGQCKVQIMVQKDGKMISNTPATVSFPITNRPAALGTEAGTYFVTVKGSDGCMGQAKTAEFSVAPERAPTRVAGR